MTDVVYDMLFLQLPAWGGAAAITAVLVLRSRLRDAERRIARHERLFARIDRWASDIDRHIGAGPAPQRIERRRNDEGKVIPFPHRPQF